MWPRERCEGPPPIDHDPGGLFYVRADCADNGATTLTARPRATCP
ncbi:hypothetical protein EMIT0111MI5_10398 [Burkholderia sp. IT-111MI5]